MGSAGIKVFAPATVSNLACGFDILGLALDAPGDEIIAHFVDEPGCHIASLQGDRGKLPRDPKANTATVAGQALLDHLDYREQGIAFQITKKMPFASGLGSSAASAVAGVMAVNELLRRPLEKRELLPFAMAGEQIASQAWHADNVAPCLLGGIILIRDNQTLDVHRLPTLRGLYVAVLHPHLEIPTAESRAALSGSVQLPQLITQTGNLGGFIQGLYQSDLELIGRSLQDVVIEPQRSGLIPHFAAVQEAALNAEALGCSISGAGPSIFALCANSLIAENVATAMESIYRAEGLPATSYISGINLEGARKF